MIFGIVDDLVEDSRVVFAITVASDLAVLDSVVIARAWGT
jgi:hypothetical protein